MKSLVHKVSKNVIPLIFTAVLGITLTGCDSKGSSDVLSSSSEASSTTSSLPTSSSSSSINSSSINSSTPISSIESSLTKLQAPVITLTNNIVSWDAVPNAINYKVSVNENVETITETSYTISNTAPGSYNIFVTAISAGYLESDKSNTVTYVVEEPLAETKVYVVGDSTVCSFTDTSYYYPRYGYGTQLSTVLDSKATINNLALSGRSSLSYINEENYTTVFNEIKANDYLIIGFGHNDEKSDDPTRYSEPLGSKETVGSFKYNLYNYYITKALEKNAKPILATPIVRANSSNDYSGASGHITNGADYSKVIKELGAEVNVPVIDLTAKTKARYTEIGYTEAIKYHAWTSSKAGSVDNTHLNIYGAKTVAYYFAQGLLETNSTLASYVKTDISLPLESERVSNPNYVESSYAAPDLANYQAPSHFATISEGWYGTAFGDTGGSPSSEGNGFMAKEETAGTFTVGQQHPTSNKGKIGSTEGIAFLFRQISKSKNFKITADAEITADKATAQAGFGMMLRDDAYINLTSQDATILSNYTAAGMYITSSGTNIDYSRVNTRLVNSGNLLAEKYTTGENAKLTIERIGQVVNCTVIYKDVTYMTVYTDFDYTAIDNDYMYLGMYATRGTVVNFTNVDFNITGDAIEA